jgi:hypothetical protein
VNVSKAAIDPVWYLPGVAERFGMYVSLSFFCLFSCRSFLVHAGESEREGGESDNDVDASRR